MTARADGEARLGAARWLWALALVAFILFHAAVEFYTMLFSTRLAVGLAYALTLAFYGYLLAARPPRRLAVMLLSLVISITLSAHLMVMVVAFLTDSPQDSAKMFGVWLVYMAVSALLCFIGARLAAALRRAWRPTAAPAG